MKIEIDTERDSEREFRAAIRLLEGLLGQRREDAPGIISGDEQASPAVQSGGLFNMFGDAGDQPDAPAAGAPAASAAETLPKRRLRTDEYELHESGGGSMPEIEPYD